MDEVIIETPPDNKRIKTLDQLIESCEINLDLFEIKNHIINKWDMAYKNADGDSEVEELYQVKAWLKPIENAVNYDLIRDEFIAATKDFAPEYREYKREIPNKCMAEIAIYDPHIGQLSWGKETGQDYDIDIVEEIVLDCVDNLLNDISIYKPEIIYLPLGGDIFNVNSKFNTTVSGTVQAEDTRWQKTFWKGKEIIIKCIDKILNVAPVQVIGISGNHDEERLFYLMDTLLSWYRLCSDVEIDNSPTPRKYYLYGNTLLGFCHGDKEIKGILPLKMAESVPDLWAKSKYREWHKGHLHYASKKYAQVTDEEQGVIERVLPSLVALDDWHNGKGYAALRQSEAFIYDYEKGLKATFAYKV